MASLLPDGEAARAGLAVALANEPAVVLADEPTEELDRVTEATVLALLPRLPTVVSRCWWPSHSPAVARAADRVVQLVDGQVVG